MAKSKTKSKHATKVETVHYGPGEGPNTSTYGHYYTHISCSCGWKETLGGEADAYAEIKALEHRVTMLEVNNAN